MQAKRRIVISFCLNTYFSAAKLSIFLYKISAKSKKLRNVGHYRISFLIKTPFEDGNNHFYAQGIKHLIVLKRL